MAQAIKPSPTDSAADVAKFYQAMLNTGVANELNELFFAANAEERRLILLNLEIAAPLPTGRVSLRHDPAVA